MYHPTSRVLTVLELLQSKPFITGPELAERLEMNVRTVRRYIMHLQDAGIPIESNIGRHGGYRIRPGFKLPPLMLTEDEATAVMLGLLGSSWLEVGQSSLAVEGALAKVSRVLPLSAREKLQAMSSHLFLFSGPQETRPDASLLITLSTAIGRQQRVLLAYRSARNQATQRPVEPYGIVGWEGRWYLVGYCCLRQDYRTFRLDRIQQSEVLEEIFERPKDFDCQTYVREKYQRQPARWHVEVVFHAPLHVMQQRIPVTYGTLTTTEDGTHFKISVDNLDALARYLTASNQPFVVRQPPELRASLLRLAEHIASIARE